MEESCGISSKSVLWCALLEGALLLPLLPPQVIGLPLIEEAWLLAADGDSPQNLHQTQFLNNSDVDFPSWSV